MNMDKTQFKNRIYDIYNIEYDHFKFYETFEKLKEYLQSQNKNSYSQFVDKLEDIYQDFYGVELYYSELFLKEALEELFEDVIHNNEDYMKVHYTSNEDKGTFDFTVNGISFFDENFLNEVEKL